MKLLILSLILSLPVFAENKAPGSSCGLADSIRDQNWKASGEDLVLNNPSEQEINNLSALARRQILQTALNMADADERIAIKTPWDAANYLGSLSMDASISIRDYELNQQSFTQVSFRPDQSTYGLIFKHGSMRALALITESEIFCQ